MSARISPRADEELQSRVNLSQRRKTSMLKTNNELFFGKTIEVQSLAQGKIEAESTTPQSINLSSINTMSDWIFYNIENQIASDGNFTFALIALLFGFFFVLYAILWYILGQIKSDNFNNDDENRIYGTESLNDAFYFALQMLSAGGYDPEMPEENGFRALFFLMILTGLVVFAILVGFITDAVTGYMEALKDGTTKVLEENHTLILGWNEATARCVVQMSFLRRQYQMLNEAYYPFLKISKIFLPLLGPFLERPSTTIAANNIIILCNNRTKDEVHHMLHNILDERGISNKRTRVGNNIVCRYGDPTNINDLIRVGAHRAAAILVQVTEDDIVEEDNSEGCIQNGATLRVALALRNTLFANPYKGDLNRDLRIVLQMSKPSPYVDAVCFKNHSGHEVFLPMDLSVFLNTLLFRSASQPGLAQVLMMIFDFEGISIRRRRAQNLRGGPNDKYGYCIGKKFSDLHNQYDTAIFIGLVRPRIASITQQRAANLGLVCDPNIIIENDDLLLFLGPKSTPSKFPDTEEKFTRYKEIALQKLKNVEKVDHVSNKTWKNIMICGWRAIWKLDPSRFMARVMEIVKFRLPGSVITFVNFVDIEEFEIILDMWSSSGLSVTRAAASNDPCPPDPDDNVQQRLYELTSQDHEISGIFIRHVQGDAASPVTIEAVLKNTIVHTAIVLGTQAFPGDASKQINIPPKSRDTRVLCIMLLLRKVCSVKLETKAENIAMHVVGENQEDMTTRLALGPRQRGMEEGEYREPDFVNTQAIYARVLTQTLAYPLIKNAINDIFEDSPGSCALEMCRVSNYLPLNEELSFGVVRQMLLHQTSENARCICIGYQDKYGKVVLMPHHDEKRLYVKGESLILFRRESNDSSSISM